ncbi:unnamed protein product, partial [Rotaria magnacalcarata]
VAFSKGFLLRFVVDVTMICLVACVLLSGGRLKENGINSHSNNELFNDDDDDEEEEEEDDDKDVCFDGSTGKADFDRLRLNNKALLCFSIISFVDALYT